MKRSGKLIALCAALALCVGLYFLASSLTEKQAAAQQEQTSQEAIDLSAGAAQDISALRWTVNGESLALARDGEGWLCDSDGSCPIDAQKADAMADAAAALTAAGSLETQEELSAYGLDAPALTVTVTAADGERTYELGAQNAVTGEYYLRVDGADTLYTVDSSLSDAFSKTLDDLLALESAPADISQVTGLDIDTDGLRAKLVYLADSAGVSFSSEYNWFAVENGAYTALDTDGVTALCDALTGVAWTKCVSWNATPAELSQYGFDAPQGRVSLAYTDADGAARSFTLEFGAYEGSYVYARLEGSAMVYLTDGAVLDGFMYASLSELSPTNICPLDWDTVTGFDVLVGDTAASVTKGLETAGESGEEQTGETVSWTTAQGLRLDADTVDAWLSQLHALSKTGGAAGLEGREPQLTLTFHRSSAVFSEITLEFFSYDSASSVCVINGDTRVLVSRSQAVDLAQDAQEFLKAAAE